jgi:hypothetical protein
MIPWISQELINLILETHTLNARGVERIHGIEKLMLSLLLAVGTSP